jgi:hypothetical protein
LQGHLLHLGGNRIHSRPNLLALSQCHPRCGLVSFIAPPEGWGRKFIRPAEPRARSICLSICLPSLRLPPPSSALSSPREEGEGSVPAPCTGLPRQCHYLSHQIPGGRCCPRRGCKGRSSPTSCPKTEHTFSSRIFGSLCVVTEAGTSSLPVSMPKGFLCKLQGNQVGNDRGQAPASEIMTSGEVMSRQW